MASVNAKPGETGFYLDPNIQGIGSSSTIQTTIATPTSSSEDLSKKIRKSYTITKSRESWTEQEHDKFLEALQLFDRDWKKIEAFIGTKTVIQIRSHAQKYFLKVQKNGTSEHVPPPRPKRKAAHPYPQKASKNVLVSSQGTRASQASVSSLKPGYIVRPDSSSMLKNSNANPALSSWPHSSAPLMDASRITQGNMGSAKPTIANNCCGSSESTPRKWAASETADHGPPLRVVPDFSQVYRFIGSVFDPDTTGHLGKLKEMDPIDVETVLLLMRNLSVNLLSPDFEDHRKLLSSYNADSEKSKLEGASITTPPVQVGRRIKT
ncbi:hypothetical protein MKW94_007712 [Papaver nudicaule]|uniref:Uncharacterized protein n=1 Tax=Papaver nudicaule TaxID=74823 RepID=A0AA41V3C8_PAPNU|nr:hypothetical protein [Papaver nudicaule]